MGLGNEVWRNIFGESKNFGSWLKSWVMVKMLGPCKSLRFGINILGLRKNQYSKFNVLYSGSPKNMESKKKPDSYQRTVPNGPGSDLDKINQ